MEDTRNLAETVLKHEENVRKFNAIITVPDLQHGNNYSYHEDGIEWLCKNFGAYVNNKGYKVPDVLYYLDRRILLLVFWLDKLPSEKDIENSREFIRYFEENPPVRCKVDGGEFYISSKFKDPSIYEDIEIRTVFMVPYNELNNAEVSEVMKQQIIYYKYKEHELRRRNIHYTCMQTDDLDKVVELEFIGDYNRYFMISQLSKVVIGDKYIMEKASLRDICVNKVSTYEPGVYILFYQGEIKKVGKAESGIYQRIKDYYYENNRKQTGGEAGGHITEENKDSIEVAWLVCPRDQCKDKEKEIQLTLSYLGYDLEWDKQSAFNNKKWQQRLYDSHWKYMFNKMMDMGLLDEIVSKKIKNMSQDILLELKKVRNDLDELKEGNKKIKQLIEKTIDCTKYLCDVAEDMEV